MKKITKAVIPVAGLGTRALPFSKAVPKELLPVYGIPSLQFVVEEAVKAGIKEIIFVTSEGKEAIQEYFRRDRKLEAHLQAKGKKDILKEIRLIPGGFKQRYVIQKKASGLGDAVLHAERYIGKDYFAVFLPDDIIFSKIPAIGQMMKAADNYKKPVIAVEKVPEKMVSSYGIIKPEKVAGRVFDVLDVAEKPKPSKAFSNLGIVGRYILPASVFKNIRKSKPGAKGEIQLTDALYSLIADTGLLAYKFEGLRCDTGNKHDYIITLMKYISINSKLRKIFRPEIKKIFKFK